MTRAHDQPSRLIVPKQLREAREALALSPQEAASHLAIAVADLTSWEQGATQPPLEHLWQLSELYRRDVDYFLAPHEAMPTSLNFRLQRRHHLQELSLEARRGIAEFDELCRSAREVEALLELPKPSPLPIAQENGETLASQERMRLDLGDKPIRDLRALLEGIGVLCFHLPIPPDEFSGLSWIHLEYGPCILVNASDNPGRRSFTTAHEFAHLLRRDGDSICDLQVDRGAEREANRFATCFLMPAADVIDTFHRRGLAESIPTIDELASLARRYGASLEAMRLRLEEMNLVPKGSMAEGLLAPPSRYFGRTRPGWRRRVGEKFTSNALMALYDGRISVGKLARYLGMDIRKAIELAEGERGKAELGGIS